jgi:hypothetical protein
MHSDAAHTIKCSNGLTRHETIAGGRDHSVPRSCQTASSLPRFLAHVFLEQISGR